MSLVEEVGGNPVQREWIHCRFCDYAALRFYTAKSGKISSGYWLIRQHVEEKHPEEHARIQVWLDLETTLEHGEEAAQ